MIKEPVKMLYENPNAIHYPEPAPKITASPVRTYKLSEEELAKYRAMPTPAQQKSHDLATTAPQSNPNSRKYERKGGEWR